MIDRLLFIDTKNCRIQDYKINVDIEKESDNLKAKKPFNEYPANKLTKYQIQMSFYANILQKSGLNVEGLDAYIYENEWNHYELDVLST